MKNLLILIIIGFLAPLTSLAKVNHPFDTIMDRVFKDVTKRKVNFDKNVNINLASLKEDGSWADIDYNSTAITIWHPPI